VREIALRAMRDALKEQVSSSLALTFALAHHVCSRLCPRPHPPPACTPCPQLSLALALIFTVPFDFSMLSSPTPTTPILSGGGWRVFGALRFARGAAKGDARPRGALGAVSRRSDRPLRPQVHRAAGENKIPFTWRHVASCRLSSSSLTSDPSRIESPVFRAANTCHYVSSHRIASSKGQLSLFAYRSLSRICSYPQFIPTLA